MDPEKVKQHERFVENLNGTTMFETFLVLSPCALCVTTFILFNISFEGMSSICGSCKTSTCKTMSSAKRRICVFVKDMILITIPMILALTVFVDIRPTTELLAILTLTIGVFYRRINQIKPVPFKVSLSVLKRMLKLPIHNRKRPSITWWRSSSMMITVLAILAVDFHIFPRRLAKTEAYGFSLMDIGLGYVVISNAVVVKVEKISVTSWRKYSVGSAVLFVLGLLRYYFIQRINYQTHVTEYGVHWNFFYTLAIVRLLTFTLLKVFKRPLTLAILIGMLHQTTLYTFTEDYVMGNASRDNWVDANREGIFSLLGFTSLYLFGVSVNESFLKRSKTVQSDIEAIKKMMFASGLLFILTLCLCPEGRFPPSRRLINITYITWILAMSLQHLATALAVDLFFICFSARNELRSYEFLTPPVFESINYNGLAFFLIGNLTTGLVNILFNTMEMNGVQSFLVLVAYMTFNCGIVFVLYCKRVQLKFW